MSDARAVYNASKSGVLWQVASLPAPLCTLDPASAAFADAVAAMQSAKGLTADGKLGPGTLAAIMPAPVLPSVTDARARLLAVARAEADKGVREVGGANKGPDVEKYQRTVQLGPGNPWCAAFVAWCVSQSIDAKVPAWCSGSAVTSWHRGSAKAGAAKRTTPKDVDFKSKVAPGWIWVRATDDASANAARAGTWSQGHTGIVVAVDAVGFHTIEGNTNAAGSREGDGVYRKLHRWDDAKQIGRTVGWFDSLAASGVADVQANA